MAGLALLRRSTPRDSEGPEWAATEGRGKANPAAEHWLVRQIAPTDQNSSRQVENSFPVLRTLYKGLTDNNIMQAHG